MALVACPFCREMFTRGEVPECPVCGMRLTAADRLPLSSDAAAEHGVVDPPEHTLLPVAYLGRSRGALVLAALIGGALFFFPWTRVVFPDDRIYSGFALARRLGWVWGAEVGWAVLLPTVLSRRTIMQMRGARVAAAFLSAIPGVSALLLRLRPPTGTIVPFRFQFEPALYGTVLVSACAVGLALVFGGSVPRAALSPGDRTTPRAKGAPGDDVTYH
jgi:hypothetical protein